MAVGLAVGVTPLWGAHVFLVLLVCLPLKLDAAVAYLAANISIPPIAPFLTMAELEIGSLVLTGAPLPTSLALVRADGVGQFVKEVAVGTLVFSPAVALVGGGLTFAIGRLALRKAPPSTADRVAMRYAADGKGAAYHYVRSKLSSDPVAGRVAELAANDGLGVVVDAGCGRGQLGLLLLEQGLATRVSGFDWDAKKVAVGTRAATKEPALPASFRVADVTSPVDEEADTALLIDVLHYLTDEQQDAALRGLARKARRLVVIREVDPGRGWRSALTRLAERLTTGLGYNKGARVNPRPIGELARVLEEEGFAVEVTPCWNGTPFANVLVVGHRRWQDPVS